MRYLKAVASLLLLITIFSLTACTGGNDTSTSTFPGIDNANIPDILEKTVGTLGNTYYSSDITDNPDYKSVLTVTFENTTEADYDTLMKHYQSTSAGIDENNALSYDWGLLQVSSDNDAITINALIK
jgi:hypothetical protein